MSIFQRFLTSRSEVASRSESRQESRLPRSSPLRLQKRIYGRGYMALDALEIAHDVQEHSGSLGALRTAGKDLAHLVIAGGAFEFAKPLLLDGRLAG